ncbi:MAG: hypothetical protein B6U72_01835 [Candidatus Altiarchaeales archaeon ex4484_2]|nr:MAG: hypothetical protein B6U72_01835 [Candidatus Altiarchaeales archaeon ex4484_2]
MEYTLSTVGSYPRPEWFSDYLKKQEGLQKGSRVGIDDSYMRALAEVLGEQKKSGIRLLTDGQLLWQNMLCHLCDSLDGFRLSGLIRYFDNNMYYQMPEAVGRVERGNPIILDEYRAACSVEKNIKPVLSCYSLVDLSQNRFYGDEKEFLMDVAEVMNQEAKALAGAGASIIQVDEPSLLFADKEGVEAAGEALEVLTKGVNASFILATYFRDAKGLYPEILDYPIDVLGLDFVEGLKENLKLIKEHPTEKIIQAGVVDGRTTLMEKPSEVKEVIDSITELVSGEKLFLSPNTGLEYLPYVKASEKMGVLSASVD